MMDNVAGGTELKSERVDIVGTMWRVREVGYGYVYRELSFLINQTTRLPKFKLLSIRVVICCIELLVHITQIYAYMHTCIYTYDIFV